MSSNGSLRNVGGNKALPKFGLILKGKNAPSSSKPTSTPGKTSFTFTKRVSSKNALGAASDSDADDLDADGDVPISDFSLGAANAGKSVSEQRKVNKELRAVQAQKERQAEEAQRKAMEEDPTVYDYDAVYDDLKEAENEKKRGIDNPSGGVAKKV
ncbi:hypothetical protein HK097_003164 [Rhizophlyctis rosea]|uniref:Nuclear speckle splicing regulatory protein 1 N-terminal domain-containing protein n=1 Tax=Rhizophlyctis rosea TaxID=64517 RepID=A0AAD5S2R6_9FUNG|nr:hypothetical protein HK097_003164 [Rhizophlyctis rosea]